MPRYKLVVEYDGSGYVGWQKQKNGHSIQAALETAIYEFSNQVVKIGGGSRTDSGVHALGQVAHFDLEKKWLEDKLKQAVNSKLRLNGEQIAVMQVNEMPIDWDSRFSATKRHYFYRIINRTSPLTIDQNFAWLCKKKLNVEAMNDAAQVLVGHHDFSTFRHANCQAKSPVKTLATLTVKRGIGDEIIIETSSKSYLHNQVRSMVGSLRMVGENKWTKDDLKNALNSRNRASCGPVAPACGLYLKKVDYDIQ